MQNIFISSTFIDMQYERDILNDQVLPQLSEFAESNGERVALSDLRWGINTEGMTEEEGAEKVLSICFEEIDRCKPYFLSILGDRYGWIPDKKQINQANIEVKFPEKIEGKSATELEVLYGILNDPAMMERGIFLFRNMEGAVPADYLEKNPENIEKMRQLKERIMKACPERVFQYTISWISENEKPEGLEEFQNIAFNKTKNLLERDWAENASLTNYQKDQLVRWQEINQIWKQYDSIIFEEYTKKVKDAIEDGKDIIQLNFADPFLENITLGIISAQLKSDGCEVLPLLYGTEYIKCNDDIIKYIAKFVAENFLYYSETREFKKMTLISL